MKALVLVACVLGWAGPAAAETILDFAWTSETFVRRDAEAAPAGGTVSGRGTAVFDPAAGLFLFEAPGQPGPLLLLLLLGAAAVLLLRRRRSSEGRAHR